MRVRAACIDKWFTHKTDFNFLKVMSQVTVCSVADYDDLALRELLHLVLD